MAKGNNKNCSEETETLLVSRSLETLGDFVPGTAMSREEIARYAQVSLDMLDVREGELLAVEISSDEQIPFAAALSLEAAERGVLLEVLNPLHSISQEELEARRDRIEALAENDAKFLSLFAGVNAQDVGTPSADHAAALQNEEALALRKQWFKEAKMAQNSYTDQTGRWALAPWPSQSWANISTEGDLRELSEHMLHQMRAHEPGLAQEHMATLRRRGAALTEAGIEELRIQDASGTDLRMRVATGAHFQAVDFQSDPEDPSRRHFVNLNTDEVFTTPDYRSVEGTICSQYPVTLGGHKIHQIKARYQGGEMIEATAYNSDGSVDKAGTNIMNNHFVGTPAGRLGEVGLCDSSAALSGSGRDFDSEVVNEDAVVCHVATGQHFGSVTGGSPEQLNEKGGHEGFFGHIDWGIGGEKASVSGKVLSDGHPTWIGLVENGTWTERFQ